MEKLDSTEITAVITCAVYVLDTHYRKMEEPSLKSQWEQKRLESALAKLEAMRAERVKEEAKLAILKP